MVETDIVEQSNQRPNEVTRVAGSASGYTERNEATHPARPPTCGGACETNCYLYRCVRYDKITT